MLKSNPFGPFDPDNPCRIPGVFAANILTECIEIDAPVALVWAIMTDFERYPVWNPLNRFFVLDTRAEVGQTVTFGPRWGPYASGTLGKAGFMQRETLTVWEENCCLAYATIASWVNAERVQYLAPIATDRTRYSTYERTAGILAPLVRLLYRRRIVTGFCANGLALKERAEAAYANESETGAHRPPPPLHQVFS